MHGRPMAALTYSGLLRTKPQYVGIDQWSIRIMRQPLLAWPDSGDTGKRELLYLKIFH